MEFLNAMLGAFDDWLYTYILIALLLIAGIVFTLRTKAVQVRLFPEAVRVLLEKNNNKKAVSSFQALMISTASRVGVGNIAGVATAIATGGAGAVFWMWLIAIIGAASAFTESTLAQIYKVRKQDGSFRGGPAYYMERVLKSRPVAVLFSILLIACFGFGFNPLQANNVASALEPYFGSAPIVPVIIGLVLAALTAYVIFGGQDKIARITSVMVPVMAVIYLAMGLVVIFRNIGVLPETLGMIFKEAFDFQAIFGGFAGSAVMMGIKRGLFSNEAGMGSAPNAAASAEVSHPVKQGLVQVLSVFIDTIMICTTSAFIILLSGVETQGLKAMPLMQAAIRSQFGEIGTALLTLSIFFFAFSSIVGNYYYTESNMFFIMKKETPLTVFRLTIVLAVFLGCVAGYDLVWSLADILMGFMTILNVIVILFLGKIAVKALNDYVRQKKEGKNPVFVASEVGIDDCDLWQSESDH